MHPRRPALVAAALNVTWVWCVNAFKAAFAADAYFVWR